MMHLIRRWLLAILLLPALQVQAADHTASTLQVVSEDWPPYHYLAADGSVSGINANIVRAVLNQAGLSAPMSIYPWARSLFLASHRPNTLIFSLARTKEREAQFLWIGELMRRNDWFFRATGHDSIAPQTLAEVKSCCSVCVVRRDVVEDDLLRQGFVPGKHYITGATFAECMKLVQRGAVPLLVNGQLDLKWELKKHPEIYSGFQPVLPLSGTAQESLYLAASLGTPPATVARLRAAFALLQQNGTLAQLRNDPLAPPAN